MMHWVVTLLATSLLTILQQVGAWTKTSRCTVTCSIRGMVQKKKSWERLISPFKIVCILSRLIIGTTHLEAQPAARIVRLCVIYGPITPVVILQWAGTVFTHLSIT